MPNVVMLTVDNLSLLQVLLQEFDTAIDAALHLLVGADLHGNIVSRKQKVSHVQDRMPALRHCRSDQLNSLCNSNQLSKTEIIARHNNGNVPRDDTSLVDDRSL
jgi:hypothetical protein